MLAIATTLAAARRRVRALAVLLAFTSVAAATLACVADAAMVVVAAAAVCSGVAFALDALDGDTHVDEATYWTALLAYTRTPASVGVYARHFVGRSPPTATIAVAVERYNRALTPT